MEINDLTGIVIEESIKLHSDIGPGLLESVYEEVLYYRLKKRGLDIKNQFPIPFQYEEVRMNIAFRADLIINDLVIVEIKSVERLEPVHGKQMITYLKLTGLTVGLLINFNEKLLKNGIKRIVNDYHPVSSAAQRETKNYNYE